jgi:hypothetical protein
MNRPASDQERKGVSEMEEANIWAPDLPDSSDQDHQAEKSARQS